MGAKQEQKQIFEVSDIAEMLQQELRGEDCLLFLEELAWFINHEQEDIRLFFTDSINHHKNMESVRLKKAREQAEEEALREAWLVWEMSHTSHYPPNKDKMDHLIFSILHERESQKTNLPSFYFNMPSELPRTSL